MRLEPIAEFIENNTNLIRAKTLFVHSMPAGVNPAVLMVTENAGNRVDHEVKGVFLGRYQVIVRDASYSNCSTRAYELFSLLYLLEENMGEYVVTYSRPRHTPNPIGGRSAGDLVELSINFDLRYRSTS